MASSATFMAPYITSPVIWSEGLLLGPHQFQQADRYHMRALDARVRPLVPYGRGTIALGIDTIALRNSNIFKLDCYRGIFDSGTSVAIPEGDHAPKSRQVQPQDFAAEGGRPGDRLGVYLALPVDRPNALNFALPGDDASRLQARYVPDPVSVVDECSGGNEREVVLARKNLRLLFEHEAGDGLERLKIAELLRTSDGRVSLDETYIPSALVIGASPHLQALLEGLTGTLTRASEQFLGAQQQAGGRYTFGAGDMGVLWLLGVLHAQIPVLAHTLRVQQVHPEVVYRHLLTLAGQLPALSVRVRVGELSPDDPTRLPPYDHDDLRGCFARLIDLIEMLLKLAQGPAAQPVSLPLEKATSRQGSTVLRTVSEIADYLFAPGNRFFVVLQAPALDVTHRDEVSRQVQAEARVAAFEQIDDHIDQWVRGAVQPPNGTPSPPHGAPARPDAIYLAVQVGGLPWERIRQTRSLAVHMREEVRDQLAHLSGELLVLPPDDQPGP